ncbi:unnamed protein product [Caenorhabditis auriculariae]|uniref:Battenin n=1 Tax=Caenorhabditis auriculariae TaxID=2777116 RepID=A0A8S1H7I4_9PELO|nr:unnamed protein product [Caenorhabditis auriculariae]
MVAPLQKWRLIRKKFYMVDWTLVRNVVAFFGKISLLGLCNNYGYVIMLSAAEDILDVQQHGKTDNSNTTSVCEKDFTSRKCSSISTGAVLLADNLPGLFVQTTFPFFMHRIPFGFRCIAVFLLQGASYFIVAYSKSIAMSLAGVCFASLGQGMGEITFLALAAHFTPATIAAWSSGTGGAGLIGSFSYAFLTQPNMAGLSPSTALLIQLFIPVLFAVAYFLVLNIPDTVYTPSFNPTTWIVPENHDEKVFELSGADSDRVPQRELSIAERCRLIVPLLHLMIPLATVYMAEYMINQGLTEMITFKCSQGLNLPLSSQYRWYQVLYQLGVFLSRSSVKIFEMPIGNLVFFFFEAVYWFVPSIIIIFGLIIFEGLLGGAAYVNTYNMIHKKVEPDVREYSLSAASMGNSIGTNIAAFLSIPLHNWVDLPSIASTEMEEPMKVVHTQPNDATFVAVSDSDDDCCGCCMLGPCCIPLCFPCSFISRCFRSLCCCE